jgi:hypothetical protein
MSTAETREGGSSRDTKQTSGILLIPCGSTGDRQPAKIKLWNSTHRSDSLDFSEHPSIQYSFLDLPYGSCKTDASKELHEVKAFG